MSVPSKDDLVIYTPTYIKREWPDQQSLDPDSHHLVRISSTPNDTGLFNMEHITAETTQAMCEALAFSMAGKHSVWIANGQEPLKELPPP